MHGPREFAYQWTGSTHYLALHDLRMTDGETISQDAPPSTLNDLRDLMTFVPEGCAVSGWSRLRVRRNLFTAVYYDPAILPEELDTRIDGTERPMLYFNDPGLRTTLGKIQALLSEGGPVDAIYGETLGLAAAIELARLQLKAPVANIPDSRRLGFAQERLVRDYIEENLQNEISLSDLAGLVGLSRFHFTRSFKRTTGLAPYQFIVASRIEGAKAMLAGSEQSMLEISGKLGFGNQARFSAAFRKATGVTPSQYRRDRR